MKLKGHKKAISALSFNKEGNLLVSGSNDCTIVLWDLISETGICRLKGHRDMVTSVLFLEEYGMLLSASKDTLLKVWSIEGQYCLDTYIGHRTEIWSMVLFSQPGYKEGKEGALGKYNLLTGSSDQSLRLFSVYREAQSVQTDGEDGLETKHHLEYRGCLTLTQTGRTVELQASEEGTHIGYYNASKAFLLYAIRPLHESVKKMKRRVHRRKEKGGEAVSSVQCTDALELVSTVSTSHKVSSFDFGRTLAASDEVEVLFGLNNNSMQVYKFGRSNGKKEESGGAVENTGSYEKTLSIALAGHRSDVRALCLTSTDDMVLSVGQKESKMWSVRSLECVRSLDVENGLCCCVLPGDKHAVIGTKDGKLVLVDLNTGDVLQTLQAHKGSIWSVDVRRDGKGMVSGGSDHNICFWEISFAWLVWVLDGSSTSR